LKLKILQEELNSKLKLATQNSTTGSKYQGALTGALDGETRR
jgi:hypothetical protein